MSTPREPEGTPDGVGEPGVGDSGVGAQDDGPDGSGPEISPLLARATGELRAAPERAPTWQDVSESVVTALRTVARRSTWVSTALDRDVDGPGSGTDTMTISDQALTALVRRGLRNLPGCAPAGLQVEVDDAGRCTGVVVEVVAAYGLDLRALAVQVQQRCAAVLLDAIGPESAPPLDAVAVRVVDITEDDPRS